MITTKNKDYFKESRYPFLQLERDLEKEISQYPSWDTILKNCKENPKGKYYALTMFAYPSGNVHCGHLRVFLYVDLVARYKRLLGYSVINPIGWDSFGLPAENAAKAVGSSPKIWTENNIQDMKKVLQSLGFSFDWSMELCTHEPEYYTHQQRIIIDMFHNGLCERKSGLVFWDPQENSVLSKEQVINGKGWRSGVDVQMKIMEQWYLKITNYTDELINDLDDLEEWPEDIKTMQRNWMGKTQGVTIDFSMAKLENDKLDRKPIKVFTTKPHMLYGCSFIALSLSHPLTLELNKKEEKVANFIKNSFTNLEEKNYSGLFTGDYCIHPLTGEKIPIYISTYVVNGFGTGAIFGCAENNLNDYNFAMANNITIKKIIQTREQRESPIITEGTMINSGEWNGIEAETLEKTLRKEIDTSNKYPFMHTSSISNLHDWCFSRQRYWGCPMPFVHCDKCGIVTVNLEDLPIKLPDEVDYTKGGNPLVHHPTWKYTNCPKCQDPALRETDTMDTFVDSSWYFFRYFSRNCKEPIDKSLSQLLMPIDIYIGGKEHAVLHLLYCRFITKVLRDSGYVNLKEPVKKLVNQGIVSMATYYNLKKKEYVYPGDVIYKDIIEESEKSLSNYDPLRMALLFNKEGDEIKKGPSQKMSKSKKNIISPMALKETYGVDVLRFMMISDNPCDREIEIREEAFTGGVRFLNAVWEISQHISIYLENKENNLTVPQEKEFNINEIFIQGEYRLSNLEVNLFAVSLRTIVMEIKILMKGGYCRDFLKKMWKNFLKMFSVICPYISQAIWQTLHCDLQDSSVFSPGWLDLKEIRIEKNTQDIKIMINNKINSIITISNSHTEEEIKKEILQFLRIEEKDINGFFLIKNRNMVNVVVKNASNSK